MRGWLLANLFFLTIMLIAAGAIFVCFSAVRALQLPADVEPWAFIGASVVALVATGYAVRELHGFIQRRI